MAPAAPAETPHLTFVIPIRHQLNAKNWSALRANLAQTVNSIANQNVGGWRAIIVANHGADLPPLPPGFAVERVDFAPNPLHERGAADLQSFYDAVRFDKGQRLLAGMLRARESEYIMFVDEDDFVSRKLSGFVSENRGQNGWFVKNGYVWRSGGSFLYIYDDFSNFCGTSHIVRTDLYGLPGRLDTYSEDNIKNMLGSHVFIEKFLKEFGFPLAPLPFRGVTYRVGHAGAHSKSSGLLRTFVFNRKNFRSPVSAVRSLARLRKLTTALREEFNIPVHLGAELGGPHHCSQL